MSDNDPNRWFSTSFPVVFLRLSYTLAEIFRWFPNCFPMVFLWSSEGFPIVFSCFLEVFLMFFLLFYYCFRLFSHGSPVVFLWFSDACKFDISQHFQHMRAHARARSRAPAPTMVGTLWCGDGGRVDVQINPGSTLYLSYGPWARGTQRPQRQSRRNQSNSCCCCI